MFDNLNPGTQFTIDDSNTIYVLLGYNSDNKILYFEKNKNAYNNTYLSDNNIIKNILYYPDLSFISKKLKYF
jgi:hypothetical protein